MYKKVTSVLIEKIYSSSGSACMAVSAMIGTAKETIQFAILVFLETQEMNLRGNSQDSKCGICIPLCELCFKKKFLPPLDPVVFSKHFYPRPW